MLSRESVRFFFPRESHCTSNAILTYVEALKTDLQIILMAKTIIRTICILVEYNCAVFQPEAALFLSQVLSSGIT